MHTHRMNMNKLSVSAACVELGAEKNASWSHCCESVMFIIWAAPKRC